MEDRYSLAAYYEIPNAGGSETQAEEAGRVPAAAGTLESSVLGASRFVQEAPEEEEESEGPLREQDLKEAYIKLVQGVQEWQDGCVYRGEFGLDMKLGHGEFSWPKGESYRGQFYRDHRHGLGTYVWPDGSSFTGMFYLSAREGYGTMYLKERLFQGLYKADKRFGPGVETYQDGSQDVGLWFHEHLIKLCVEIPGSFSIHTYPEFSGFLTHTPARITLSDEEKMEWALQEGQDPFFYDYKSFLLDDNLTLPPEMYIYSTDNSHLPMTSSFRKDLDARIFLNDIPPFVEDGEPWFIKNETPLMVKIQRQAYKFRNKRAHTSWNMGAILEGKRGGSGRRGPKERLSEEAILKAQEGDYAWVYGLLRDSLVSPDVADAKGYTALAAAAVHCHVDVVNLLLDHGADVNKCTDEGLTPLSMCFLLYYPTRSFKPNVAERTVPEPQEASKPVTIPNCPFPIPESAAEPVYLEEPVPAQGGQEPKASSTRSGGEEGGRGSWDADPRSSSLRGPTSVSSSASDSGRSRDVVSGTLDPCTPCSNETGFESNRGVCHFSIELSRDLLERSALAHSLLEAPAAQGTMRRMALSMVQHRRRWMVINALLRRGADPNLCRVPMQALFFAVKAGDVDGVKLLLEHRARTDIQFPPELGALTPLHIAAALPGEEGVRITELLLHAITDVDARAADQDDVYKQGEVDLLPSGLKLNNEAGPPSAYQSECGCVPAEGGRTPLHVACEREDNHRCARDIVRLLLSHRANPNTLWSGHSPLSLSIASGNDLIVKELLSYGADPNMVLTKGLGSALCVACDLTYESQRSLESKLALIDRLISHGANILNPVTLTQGDKVAVGTAVDYGYFRFYQDRKTAHCPFHMLMPAERETFLARKKLLEYMGLQLRRAVFAKECQWDPKVLHLNKRAELAPCLRLKRKGTSMPEGLDSGEQERVPFFKFCYQCGRSVGVRLTPCTRCYGILTCSKYCKTKAWTDFHKKDCGTLMAIGKTCPPLLIKKPLKQLGNEPQKPATLRLARKPRCLYSTYSHE
ncbi:ankyrin repeat and MYND domain-containing protein 1 isoform X3 [Hippopotamus amphibius kiboko]|uniref:ankyrin repeat and MYND domain-containing protein 1 isoform X3 n=1 Tax=Hippopotamus amphibius kiboko TaxID=575201 RepID=UPI00259393D6|nr:ankyrin repeat and MYND domain-containing protein 1 isoform X3 [Hippopotamus amphibius kiboko]XP_057600704.1 ankyrin repeat and MYND domain-containing protein 1 isoform X3 [Hippopotamus amphibius kiboko]XP_057600705.1 ankyrin repeat and MYND domain-containing protein 1 isoform X3 [Hippopotamus amphibius kiboko]